MSRGSYRPSRHRSTPRGYSEGVAPGVRSRQRPDNVFTDPLPSIGLHRGSIRRHCTEGQLQLCGVVGAGLSATERQRMTKTLESLPRREVVDSTPRPTGPPLWGPSSIERSVGWPQNFTPFVTADQPAD